MKQIYISFPTFKFLSYVGLVLFGMFKVVSFDRRKRGSWYFDQFYVRICFIVINVIKIDEKKPASKIK